MHFWNSLPLFRLVIPFILGIIFSDSLYKQRIYLFIPLLLTLLISLPHYLACKIEEESNTLGLSFHNLKSEGALVVDYTN